MRFPFAEFWIFDGFRGGSRVRREKEYFCSLSNAERRVVGGIGIVYVRSSRKLRDAERVHNLWADLAEEHMASERIEVYRIWKVRWGDRLRAVLCALLWDSRGGSEQALQRQDEPE
jgi:hypothetical protein